MQHAEQILDFLNDPDGSYYTYKDGTSLHGFAAEVEVTYWIKNPIPPEIRERIGLAIYLDLGANWEVFETYWFNLKESGFAIEDFPSDYLGFYSYTTGTPKLEIVDEALKTTWHYQDEDPPRCYPFDRLTKGADYCNSLHNFSYTPKVLDPGTGIYHNIDWPSPLKDFTPLYGNDWWHPVAISCFFYHNDVTVPHIGAPKLPVPCGIGSGADPRSYGR